MACTRPQKTSSSSAAEVDPLLSKCIEIDKVGNVDGLKVLTLKGKKILDHNNFGSCDFWQGYKLYCFACYSQCSKSKRRFVESKMGRMVSLMNTHEMVSWGLYYDQTVRQTWAMMEEYAHFYHGLDWRDLKSLMEEFDDVKELSSSENGLLLLQLVDDDVHATEGLHRQCRSVQITRTDVFENMKRRLKIAGSSLTELSRPSKKGSAVIKKRERKRITRSQSQRRIPSKKK